MTHHIQHPENLIYVTHVEADDVYLKIWGQLDKHAASCVDNFIYPLVEQFSQGYGCPSKSNRLIIGALCCARFQTDGYYRAKILNVGPDGMIIVQFIDYGNVEILPPREVHLLEGVPGSESLRAYPAMASEFTLLDVLPINGIWENRTIEAIKKFLCYNECRACIHPAMNNRYLIKILYNNEDLSEMLVRERMALPATLQDMFRPKHLLQPQMPVYQQSKGALSNFSMMQNTGMNQNISMQGMFHKTSPDVVQHKHAVPQPLPVQEALVFKSRVLDIGSKHEILVSCVEDGPQKFSVQVQSTTEILSHLMNNINGRPKKPLQEPPLPGSVCLGRFTQDKVLCRAVVMSVMEHKCKLYYVDFGHTEVLSYTDIFQLPPELINPKVLSIRFTLSGLKELHITPEMKDYFTQIVSRKLLILHVRPPEGPPLIQYGDLYDNGINIKDILKKTFPTPVTVPTTYSYPQLRQLPKDVQETVHVSFVESCKKFYVQLDSGIKPLDSIMSALGQYAKTAPIFNMTKLKVGLPCAALYDTQWYRAQILNISEDKVQVVYVDYGNEETLPLSSLCTIHDDLVTKLPAQAIKCALNGYEVLSQDQEVANHFERLTLEKLFFMKVVASQSNGLLVDLFEFETMRSIHPQLLNNPFCDKIENTTAGSQNENVQHSTQTANSNDFHSEDKDKYNRKSNVDSWNRTQNTKSFQENKSNTWRDKWSQEKQYDNRREKVALHSNRDGSQNERFSKDEATNNRFDRSYNKYDKNEISTPNRGVGGAYRGGKNRSFGSELRYNRNSSADKAWSDKDSDTSSKGSGKRGKSGFNRSGRGGKRDVGVSNRLQTTRDNNRPSYRNGKFNGDNNMDSNKFKDKEHNTNNISYNQKNADISWNMDNGNKKSQNELVTNGKLQFPSIHITLGAVKNCEMVFTNSPSDFFVQLNLEYLELESVMKSIAEIYENGGEVMQASEIQHGTCCIAQYNEDLKWYRAVIKSVERNNANVEFVDYGNTELIDFMNIKTIQKEFLKLPMQAIHCKLLGLTSTGNEETENTIFMEKVEGKSLEVEFVSEGNGIYEVLLREVINDVPKTNYVNEEFCTSTDLIKAKESAQNKKVSGAMEQRTAPSRSPYIAPDYVPFDTKWQAASYEPESKHDVIVTWFINPNKFYCQILSKEAEFKTMMNEIQKTYAGRESITHKLEIGTAVIAIFSEDSALYRAEVVSSNAQKGYIVQYIDFGNCATVNHRNIYPVEKKFIQLPRLSVQCSLKNIIPTNNSSWSEVNNDALDKCFNADKYECIFHDFNDDRYTISLIHNGLDVGDMLVQKNLAAFSVRTSTEEVIDTQPSNVEIGTLNDIERVDISLLSGQTLRATVSNVESITQFHVQLPSASKCGNIINKYMDDKNTEVMPRLSSREMCLGAGCLINANGTWRRAVVINCSRSVGFDVKFIDTGGYDEILDGTLALPGALAAMQNQALECSLQNVPASSDADKQLKELIEGKEVLIYVEEVNNSRLIVKLYDILGNRIMNAEETDENISPVCPMPILSSTHKVSVSCIDHSSSIWLQRYSDYELDAKLMEDLGKYYSTSGQRVKPEMHLFCAAKSVDGRWYRGKIVNCTETTAYVNYIDYGNTEEIALESIMVLESQFYQPYQLAVNVSLSITVESTDEVVNALQTHLLGKELMAIFYNVHKKWIVDLTENEEKLSDKFRSLNLIKEEQMVSKSSSQTQEASTTCKFDVCVSHVDSPSQFWLQRIDKITSLTENQEKLQLEVANFLAVDSILEEGSLCVAVYSIDNLWYRAEVLDADEDITTVRFIDYGNTDIIDNKAVHIRQMPDAWKNIKKYADKCRLDVIPIGTEDWSESTCERFENLVTSVDTLQAVIVADTTPKRVELYINGKSVSEMLVEEKHAIIINAEQAEPVDEIVDLELDPHSAFVCHINSPGEFWVQEEKSVADLEVMADRFMVADMFPKIDEVKEGLLCVAKYPEDMQWYRARVLSHDNNSTRVIYVDYGNSSMSTEIRALPEDLADIPPLSRKCCLELPSHVKEWSEQACEEFIKLAADGATIFLLDVLKEQETSLVKLTLDDQNVADILASLCEQHLPVIEERLPPLGEENSPNVVVSHINNPSEFWIQAESSISELEVMSDRLGDAESFLTLSTFDVETVCAARYPEDGFWYRAKIIACREGGIEVLYIDYGNSAVTEELRVLPEDIINIPTLSKRCALKKPCVAWSEKACEKFKELAAEGATMFQFETLDENDPMHVQLSLNGTNVVELLTECENIPDNGEIENKNTNPNTEEQKEIVSSEIVNNDEHASDFVKTAEQQSTVNQTDSSNNLSCIDQTEQLENITNDEAINKSSDDSNIIERHEHAEEKQNDATSRGEMNENAELKEDSEIMIPQCTSEANEMSKDLNTADVIKPDNDLDCATTTYVEESSTIVTELSVDDIVGNMVREDPESQGTDDVHSLDANNIQVETVVQDDANEQQKVTSHVQYDVNELSGAQILETTHADERKLDNAVETSTGISDSKEILSVTNEAQPQDIEETTNADERKSDSAVETATEISDSKEILSVTNEAQPQDIEETTNADERKSDSAVETATEISDSKEILSVTNEAQPQDTEETTNADEKKLDSAVETATEISDSKEILSVTNEARPQDIVEVDADQIEQQEVCSEVRLSTNESLEPQTPEVTSKTSTTSCLPEEKTDPPEQVHGQSLNEDKTVAGSTNEDNLEIISEITDMHKDVNTSLKSTSTVIMTESPSVIKTDSAEERKSLNSRSRSDDEVVPGCISKGESPRPLTPKISHSEKLVAGVVNPVEPLGDCVEENDETLTVVVEKNIPKRAV